MCVTMLKFFFFWMAKLYIENNKRRKYNIHLKAIRRCLKHKKPPKKPKQPTRDQKTHGKTPPEKETKNQQQEVTAERRPAQTCETPAKAMLCRYIIAQFHHNSDSLPLHCMAKLRRLFIFQWKSSVTTRNEDQNLRTLISLMEWYIN